VVGKLDENHATASFICNENGTIEETRINPNTDVKLISNECEMIVKNNNINIVSRIAFLRKICELNGCKETWEYAYEVHKFQFVDHLNYPLCL